MILQDGDNVMELAAEADVFDANHDVWAREHPGTYVLIRREQVVGFYPTANEAYVAGVRLWGNEPMLIRQVDPVVCDFSFPAIDLGLTDVDS